MNLIANLKQMLTASDIQQGKIIALSGDTFTVATKTGSSLIQRQLGDLTKYNLADSVEIQNKFLIGRTTSLENSIYFVVR